jgi:hypothetical protein
MPSHSTQIHMPGDLPLSKTYLSFCEGDPCFFVQAALSKKPIKDYPILKHRDKILSAIQENTVTCISGKTGCGKSTMVPHFLLLAAYQQHKNVKIMITLPRRMAATRLAMFVSKELGEECGGLVGYRVGKEKCCSERTKLFFVTVGYCLQYFTHKPSKLREYTHVILDEVSGTQDVISWCVCNCIFLKVHQHLSVCNHG